MAGGTQVLTGANTYSGGTAIASGATVQLGDGGSSGSAGSGPIALDGALILTRTDSFVLDNPISGNGTLVQRGGGTATLTGANTYAVAPRSNPAP